MATAKAKKAKPAPKGKTTVIKAKAVREKIKPAAKGGKAKAKRAPKPAAKAVAPDGP